MLAYMKAYPLLWRDTPVDGGGILALRLCALLVVGSLQSSSGC